MKILPTMSSQSVLLSTMVQQPCIHATALASFVGLLACSMNEDHWVTPLLGPTASGF